MVVEAVVVPVEMVELAEGEPGQKVESLTMQIQFVVEIVCHVIL